MDMKSAKRKLFWYDVKTWLGIMISVAICAPFMATGIGEIVGGGMILMWYWKRIQYRPFYEASLGVGAVYEAVTKMDKAVNDFNSYVLGSYSAADKLCPTCQSLYFYKEHVCVALREIHQHKPSDPVPNPNPYEWSWFKANGYVPPPADWPKTKYYISTLEPNIEVMKQEGREYYEKNGNSLWDMGYGTVPQWYVDRFVKKTVSK